MNSGGENITGQRLREAREAAGLSLSALAARAYLSKPLLGMLEKGQRRITPDHVSAIARALGVSVQTLAAPSTDPIRIAHEWLVEEHPVAVHRQAGRRVGAGLAARLEQRVIELRRLDDTVASTELHPVVNRELSQAAAVVREASYTAEVGRRLLTVVGELSQLNGWVLSDAGHHAEAERVYLAGHQAAAEAGDRALAGQLLSTLAYQMSNVGDPADALLLARTAARGAPDASPTARALLLERVAWAAARAVDRDGARRALDAVDDSYDRRGDGVAEPDWTYWLDRDEIEVMRARCAVELGDVAAAAPLLQAAIDRYPSEHAREAALYRTWLAEAYARSGDLGAAREVLAHIGETGSDRVDRRLREVTGLVA